MRVLYGRRAAVELIDLARFGPAPPKPRWIDRPHIAEVLSHLRPGSMTQVRLELMHWTGMRPSQMGRLRIDDFRLEEPIPYVAVPRGKGGRIAAVPLVPEGIAAGRPPFTVYQIRHSFAAGLRRTGADVADIQDLYGHTNPETTMTYAPPELAKHRAAMERLRQHDATSSPAPLGIVVTDHRS